MKRFLTFVLTLLLLLLSCVGCDRGSRQHGQDVFSDENAAGDAVDSAGAVQTDQLTTSGDEQTPQAETPPEEDVSSESSVRVIDPAKPMVALTFDDGPDGTYTGEIMDTLEEYNALATFFLVGRNVTNYPDVVTRMAESGFEIGSHSYAHSDLSKMSSSAIQEDLAQADAAIEEATGSAPYLIRPPYGASNSTVRAAAGRPLICWNVDTEDWKSRDVQTIVDYVQGLTDMDGDVLLFHSIYESTADAIAILVPWFQEQGYQLVTVTELMSYYYGEWPQPAETYWNYFMVTPRTEDPLPLPGPGDLKALPPEDVSSASAAPTSTSATTTSSAPAAPNQPETPAEKPADPAEQPADPPAEEVPAPEEPTFEEAPPEEELSPSEEELSAEEAPDESGGKTEPGDETDPGQSAA